LLDVLTRATILYLNAQIAAGAQTVMVFDTWGGVLADGAFQKFALASTRRVVEQLLREHDGEPVPSIVFTKGGGQWLEQIAACGSDAVGVDWTVNLADARARIGGRCALQGNLDPIALFAPEAALRAEVAAVLESFGRPMRDDHGGGDGNHGDRPADQPSGHVFNLGHGISQFTPPEAVSILVDAVHQTSRRMRA
jgi:uroporphyrinogen decarboxylase